MVLGSQDVAAGLIRVEMFMNGDTEHIADISIQDLELRASQPQICNYSKKAML